MSFPNQAKPAAMLTQSFSCAFRLQAGQVTQHDKMHGQVTHAFILTFIPQDVLSLVFPLMLEGLFFPTHSFFLVSLPFYSTQVCVWTSVHLNIGQVSVKYRAGVLIQVYNIYYKHDSPASRLYISQAHSLKARLWGKCHCHFPIFKKRALPAVLFCSLERNALKFTKMAANVGPRAQ